MEFPYPTFKEFSSWNDSWRDVTKNQKQPLPKWQKGIYYFFALIGITFLYITIIGIIGMCSGSSSSRKYPSSKYRKVIKEGILWDSIEYHER